jgi:dimethylargininase
MPVAITRKTGPAIAGCELTHVAREPIDVPRAVAQHTAYERTLAQLGVRVVSLPEERDLPDAVFVEDIAVVFPELAVITRPGAPSRRGETASVAAALAAYRRTVTIASPGTLDGGDVLTIGRRVLVGLSARSNRAGIRQLGRLISPHGFRIEVVPVTRCLHLKSAVTLVGRDTVLLNPVWIDQSCFAGLRHLAIDPGEPFAANALLIGDDVIYPEAFPATAARLQAAGVRLVTVDVSEIAKAEGGVTCCSVIVDT